MPRYGCRVQGAECTQSPETNRSDTSFAAGLSQCCRSCWYGLAKDILLHEQVDQEVPPNAMELVSFGGVVLRQQEAKEEGEVGGEAGKNGEEGKRQGQARW